MKKVLVDATKLILAVDILSTYASKAEHKRRPEDEALAKQGADGLRDALAANQYALLLKQSLDALTGNWSTDAERDAFHQKQMDAIGALHKELKAIGVLPAPSPLAEPQAQLDPAKELLQEQAIRAALRSALAWGKVYGEVIPNHQWDEMREQQVEQGVKAIYAAVTPAERNGECTDLPALPAQIPPESSDQAAALIEAMLKEYGYPTNPTNAARAGYRAARLYSAASEQSQFTEVEGDVQLRACDQSTGREYFLKTGPRAAMQAEADKMNAKGHDYFVFPKIAEHASEQQEDLTDLPRQRG